MSLYNMVGGGRNPLVPLWFQLLHKQHAFDPPRFRDIWLENEGRTIVLLTRTGGGNRDEYQAENDAMRLHPMFVDDRDDAFDNTYAEWRFAVPVQLYEPMSAVFKYVYEGRGQGPKAVTESVVGAMDGKPSQPIGPAVKAGISDVEKEVLRKALERILEEVK